MAEAAAWGLVAVVIAGEGEPVGWYSCIGR